MALIRQTLCYVFRDGPDGSRQVLLGHKLRGFGTGKIMGLGGHVEPGETDAEAAVREMCEESGVVIDLADVSQRASITYLFPTQPNLNAHVGVFFGERWTGTVTPCAEIRPEWFPVDAPPLDQMWDDDRYWLDRVLAGERLTAVFTFDAAIELVVDAEIGPYTEASTVDSITMDTVTMDTVTTDIAEGGIGHG